MIDQAIRKQLQSPDFRFGRVFVIRIETAIAKQDGVSAERAWGSELTGHSP